MSENKKCAHPACNCMAPKDNKYCSEYCHDAGSSLESSCKPYTPRLRLMKWHIEGSGKLPYKDIFVFRYEKRAALNGCSFVVLCRA